MSVQEFASLIRRHEGNPQTWISAVYDHSSNPETELSTAIAQAAESDRYYTATALKNTRSRHQLDNVAYQQVYGASADSYRAEAFRQGQEFLNMLIQALENY